MKISHASAIRHAHPLPFSGTIMRTGKESRLNRHLEGEGHTAVGNAHLNEDMCPTPTENQCEPIQYVLSPTQEHRPAKRPSRFSEMISSI